MEEADFLWGSAPALNHAKIGFGAIGGIRMLGHKVRGVWAIPQFPVRCRTICTTNIEFDNPASFPPRVRADIDAVRSRIDVVTFSFKALDLYSYSAALVTEQDMLRNLTKPSVKQQINLTQINTVLSFWHEFAGRHRDLSPRGIIRLAEDLLGTILPCGAKRKWRGSCRNPTRLGTCRAIYTAIRSRCRVGMWSFRRTCRGMMNNSRRGPTLRGSRSRNPSRNLSSSRNSLPRRWARGRNIRRSSTP